MSKLCLPVFVAIATAAVSLAWQNSICQAAGDNADLQAAYQQTVDRAVRFLRTKGQAPDGSYSARPGRASRRL